MLCTYCLIFQSSDFLFFFLSLFISSHLGAFLLHKGLMYLHHKFHIFSWSFLVHSLYCLLFSLVIFLIFFYSHAYPDVGFLFIVTFDAGFSLLSFVCVMTHFLDHGTRIGGFFKPCSGFFKPCSGQPEELRSSVHSPWGGGRGRSFC